MKNNLQRTCTAKSPSKVETGCSKAISMFLSLQVLKPLRYGTCQAQFLTLVYKNHSEQKQGPSPQSKPWPGGLQRHKFIV